MKSLITLILIISALPLFAFEGVIHGVKTTNGKVEEFDIYIKGDKIAVEGTNHEGYFKVIIDRSTDEFLICMDSPYFENKGYFRFQVDHSKNKKIKVLSSHQKGTEQIDGEECSVYSMSTNLGAVILRASTTGKANLSGLSKYMDDPVYEIIDHFGITNSVRKIVVDKPQQKYVVTLTEQEKTVSDNQFQVPAGFEEYKIELKN